MWSTFYPDAVISLVLYFEFLYLNNWKNAREERSLRRIALRLAYFRHLHIASGGAALFLFFPGHPVALQLRLICGKQEIDENR